MEAPLFCLYRRYIYIYIYISRNLYFNFASRGTRHEAWKTCDSHSCPRPFPAESQLLFLKKQLTVWRITQQNANFFWSTNCLINFVKKIVWSNKHSSQFFCFKKNFGSSKYLNIFLWIICWSKKCLIQDAGSIVVI